MENNKESKSPSNDEGENYNIQPNSSTIAERKECAWLIKRNSGPIMCRCRHLKFVTAKQIREAFFKLRIYPAPREEAIVGACRNILKLEEKRIESVFFNIGPLAPDVVGWPLADTCNNCPNSEAEPLI